VAHEDVDTVNPITNETFSRLGTFVNGTYPGLPLTADFSNDVVVNVINNMPATVLMIHCHGQHQVQTNYMDGVHRVTQCDIQPMQSFEYRFTAGPAGTFIYHSHVPYQFGDGSHLWHLYCE